MTQRLDPKETIKAARALMLNERAEEAVRLLSVYLEYQDNPYVWQWLAMCYQILGENVIAKGLLRNVVLRLRNPHIVDIIAAEMPYTKAIASDSLEMLYFNIPKCGSSSIKDGMLLADGQKMMGGASHFHVEHLNRIVAFDDLDNTYKRYTKLAIVRHPRDRLRSYWNKNVNEERSLRAEASGRDTFYGLSSSPTYLECLQNFQRYRNVFRDFRHHTDSAEGYLGRQPKRIDFLMPIEKTDKALALIAKRADIKIPSIRNMASSTRFEPQDDDELTLEQQILDQHYSEEIELYF